MRLKKFLLYYRTIKHLKIRQLYYQAFYRLKKSATRQHVDISYRISKTGNSLKLEPGIFTVASYNKGTFEFLNKKKFFSNSVDWDFKGYGKLWAYNLNYFDFLNQDCLDTDEGLRLIKDFCYNIEDHKEASEPYTISLRGINWIKFFSYRQISNADFDRRLFAQYKHLAANLEFHLLGNHLLENGFSMLFGAYYFQDDSFYNIANQVLTAELNEQILADGAHFELSPMYHQILLFRLLDAINLVRNNNWKNDALLPLLIVKARAMLGWLEAVTFKNGDVPMVNDAAFGIAPSSVQLSGYAARLLIQPARTLLSTSGYRMIVADRFQLFLDVGNIGPDYIPGHAHSDTFSFILHINSKPVIVDTGTSTYDAGARRQEERSTSAHNSVVVNNEEQSEVWGTFRVGRRAKIVSLKEETNGISAAHNGFGFMGINHERSWRWSEDGIEICDVLHGANAGTTSVAYIHFHPDVQVAAKQKGTICADDLLITIGKEHTIVLDEYDYAAGFNATLKGTLLKVQFHDHLQMMLKFVRRNDSCLYE